jgi:hypothetical protein
MWLLANAMGYNQMRLGYADCTSSVRCHQLNLDEINVAGQLAICELMVLATLHIFLPYAVHALRLITDRAYFEKQIQPPKKQSREEMKSTAEKWREHIESLVQWRVLRYVQCGAVHYTHKYFAIAKSCGKVARAIFNGRSFSNEGALPRSVNLPDVAELMRVLSSAFDGRKYSFMCADWRHWFYQFGLKDDIQAFFGVRMLDVFLVLRVLPMGWSHSPLIAQSTGWLIILEVLRRCGVDISEYIGKEQLPPYIHVEQNDVVLVIALWYDNVGFFCSDDNLTNAFGRHFTAVCSDFRVAIKEQHLYSQREMDIRRRGLEKAEDVSRTDESMGKSDKGGKPPATYLGMEIGWSFDIPSKRIVFQWRHSLARRRRWLSQCPLMPCTCRAIAQLVGIIVWNCHMHLKPLALIRQSIEVLRKASSIKALRPSSSAWDTVEPALNEDVERLRAEVALICRNSDWIYSITPKIHRQIIIASDASSKLWGYIIYDACLSVLHQNHDTFSRHLQGDRHIFVKELLAATLAIEYVCSTYDEMPLEIVIGIDNTAAAGVLRRLYSSTHYGCEMVDRVVKALGDKHRLRVISLRSEDNPSDPLTRMRPLCPKRMKVFEGIVRAFEYGRHITEFPKSNPKREHAQVDEPDDMQYESEAEGLDEDAEFVENASPEDDASL